MKSALFFILFCVMASAVYAQGYSQLNNGQWAREKHYGAASFKADSLYVFNGTNRWVTLTASLDTTAGTTIAYVCINNDSTNAFPLTYGIGGNWGASFTEKIWGLKWLRVKGAVPVTFVIN